MQTDSITTTMETERGWRSFTPAKKYWEYFGFSQKTLWLITPASGFSHLRATMTTSESGSSDRRPTTITLVNGSCNRSKLTITPEKESCQRRTWMTTFLFVE